VPHRLVLFDIDGTLIMSAGYKNEFNRAIEETVGPGNATPAGIRFAGNTDPQIAAAALRALGIEESKIYEKVDNVLRRYEALISESRLPGSLTDNVLPGVHELIQRLQSIDRVSIGLLTGNIKLGAKSKLEAAGLNHYFDFGVFGDDHSDRYKMPEIAQNRAEKEFGKTFEKKQIVVIGDTIHDVNCGKSIGVRSIAVATGYEDAGVLMAENPDFYFSSLSDTDTVIEAILEML